MALFPVTRGRDGKLTFKVGYDDVPEGFLDSIEDSDFLRLCHRGQAFAEVGHPVVDDHIDPRVALMRLRQIYPERVCGVIKVISNGDDGFIAELSEHGPHAHLLNYLDGIKKLFVAPRLIFDEDRCVVNTITFDVIETN